VACLAKRTRAPFHHAALATGVPPRLAPLEPAQPRLAAVLPALVTRHTLHMHAPTPEPFGTHAHTSLGPTLTPYHLATAGVCVATTWCPRYREPIPGLTSLPT